ncbi:MAG: Nif3-like dinuclear metal center hexameric protein [Verrucomicrobiota bacterium]
MSASLLKIASFADRLLNISKIHDYPDAYNGLQVENNGTVKKIAAATDAHEAVLRKAVQAGADLLVTHHGMFWGKPLPLTGANFRKIQWCVKNNLAVYSAHLPLDMHPMIGNNAILAKKLSLKKTKPFFESHGNLIGRMGELRMHRDDLVRRIESVTGHRARLIAGGPGKTRRVGIVSGGAGELEPALEVGLDTYITGEGAHHTFGQAIEYGINLIYAGHYATETFGIQALAQTLSKKFRVPWTFMDVPSGI